MLTHDVVRRLRRAFLTLSVALSLLLGAALVSPASADEPEAWESAPAVSAFEFVLLLIILPLAAAAVITLLTLVPLLINDKGYQPGQSWRSQVEWFGGPSTGVKAADDVTPEQIKASSKASVALNMTRATALRRIIVPQAIIKMIPPWGNLFIELLKATSLVSLITIGDLAFRAQQMNQTTFRTTEIFAIVLVIYLAIASVITVGMRALEERAASGIARGRG